MIVLKTKIILKITIKIIEYVKYNNRIHRIITLDVCCVATTTSSGGTSVVGTSVVALHYLWIYFHRDLAPCLDLFYLLFIIKYIILHIYITHV